MKNLRMKVLAIIVLAAAMVLTGCIGGASSMASSVASTVPPVSSQTPSVPASSETASVISSETSSVASSETSSVTSSETSSQTPPVATTDFSSAISTLIDVANAKRSAAGKDGSLAMSDRLTKAAAQAAEKLSLAGVDFIKSSDYKTLPDGSSLSSLVNAVDSSDGKASGISFAVWVRSNCPDPTDASDLQSDVLSGTRFAEKAAGSYKYIGAAYSCADGNTMVLVVYYAADYIA